ncbi:MAG: hypothetical protein JWL72_513 [Ilumatobacteraceae bacterium]|nr:hypothetical protein [Ilumatobacteraceae bacterium]
MSDTFDSLADRLDAISEDIADSALADLKSSVRRGDAKRSGTERTLTQARRAVEKAAHLLRSIGEDTDSAGAASSDELD